MVSHLEKECRNHIRQTLRDGKRRAVHDVCKDHEDKEIASKQFDVVRSNPFKFLSMRSVLIAKLYTKATKYLRLANSNDDTRGNGRLMHIIMYKLLFLYANLSNQNKFVNRKKVAYSNLCTTPMGIFVLQ